MVLKTCCAIGEYNSPLLQAPDLVLGNSGIPKLLCGFPHLATGNFAIGKDL